MTNELDQLLAALNAAPNLLEAAVKQACCEIAASPPSTYQAATNELDALAAQLDEEFASPTAPGRFERIQRQIVAKRREIAAISAAIIATEPAASL